MMGRIFVEKVWSKPRRKKEWGSCEWWEWWIYSKRWTEVIGAKGGERVIERLVNWLNGRISLITCRIPLRQWRIPVTEMAGLKFVGIRLKLTITYPIYVFVTLAVLSWHQNNALETIRRYQIKRSNLNNEARMWANAQRDGRPAQHRWRPLFNAEKFGWRPLLDAVQ